jgi:hypothetical protein
MHHIRGFFSQVKEVLNKNNENRGVTNPLESSIAPAKEEAAEFKSWIGIASTKAYNDLNLDMFFDNSDNSLSKRWFKVEPPQQRPSLAFSRQCKIFDSEKEAFRWMGRDATSEKSAYVLPTPYEKEVLIQLINDGHFHECFAKAINVSHYHDPLHQKEIEIKENPNFNPLLENLLKKESEGVVSVPV